MTDLPLPPTVHYLNGYVSMTNSNITTFFLAAEYNGTTSVPDDVGRFT